MRQKGFETGLKRQEAVKNWLFKVGEQVKSICLEWIVLRKFQGHWQDYWVG